MKNPAHPEKGFRKTAHDLYVAELPISDVIQIIKDENELSTYGKIGDCLMRTHTEKFMKQVEMERIFTVHQMLQITGACYKRLALMWLEDQAQRKLDAERYF